MLKSVETYIIGKERDKIEWRSILKLEKTYLGSLFFLSIYWKRVMAIHAMDVSHF